MQTAEVNTQRCDCNWRSIVAQICSLSVSVEIVAGREDFSCPPRTSRSVWSASSLLALSERRGAAESGSKLHALQTLREIGLRLGQARPRCAVSRISNPPAVLISGVFELSGGLPNGIRRYSRLEICASLNAYPARLVGTEDDNLQQAEAVLGAPSRRSHRLVLPRVVR